ncbi:hypothetical protein [Novosphingobium sp.]|uniref:hypothetical protein n=1 Tax=Novosphingobium sp. TaxID=1874826 RepID=UPI0025EFF9C8|nr:hypothetical protein [Novosphingobium sp.]MCC6926795.1 hypothetical protein [Novosphingobium sp.]
MSETIAQRQPARLALTDFITELKGEYEGWYVKATRRTYKWYAGLQVLVLLSSFVTAVISATISKEMFDGWGKAVLICLPMIGGLAAGVISQFKLYDMWRLREDGRLAFQELVSEGRCRLAGARDEADCNSIHLDLHKRAQAAERAQAGGFFGFFSAATIAEFRNAPVATDRAGKPAKPARTVHPAKPKQPGKG